MPEDKTLAHHTRTVPAVPKVNDAHLVDSTAPSSTVVKISLTCSFFVCIKVCCYFTSLAGFLFRFNDYSDMDSGWLDGGN
jgi:hypothetical protein